MGAIVRILPYGNVRKPGFSFLCQSSGGKQTAHCIIVLGLAVVPLDAYRKVMQFGGVILARALMGSRFVKDNWSFQAL